MYWDLDVGEELQKCQKLTKKGAPKFVFWGRQVGAFSVFGTGYTGNPVQIWRFWAYFSEICQT